MNDYHWHDKHPTYNEELSRAQEYQAQQDTANTTARLNRTDDLETQSRLDKLRRLQIEDVQRQDAETAKRLKRTEYLAMLDNASRRARDFVWGTKPKPKPKPAPTTRTTHVRGTGMLPQG